MKYDTIFFDLDGTLTDSAPGIFNSIHYALKKMGEEVPDLATLKKFLGPPLVDSFMCHCGFSESRAREALVNYREYFSTRGLFENSVYPGVEDMLVQLRDVGVSCIVATAKPELFARKILDHFSLTNYFSAIHGATMEDGRNRKDQVIAWALTHSGNLGRVLMVGDRCNDIEGAHINGLKAAGVLYGYGDSQELRQAGAEYLVSSPDELPSLACPEASVGLPV